eukprot:scaffold5458_cov131-Isochrysis_galbana.AAC.7
MSILTLHIIPQIFSSVGLRTEHRAAPFRLNVQRRAACAGGAADRSGTGTLEGMGVRRAYNQLTRAPLMALGRAQIPIACAMHLN